MATAAEGHQTILDDLSRYRSISILLLLEIIYRA